MRFKTLKGGALSLADRKRLERARHNVTPAQRAALKKKLAEVLRNPPPSIIRARAEALKIAEQYPDRYTTKSPPAAAQRGNFAWAHQEQYRMLRLRERH